MSTDAKGLRPTAARLRPQSRHIDTSSVLHAVLLASSAPGATGRKGPRQDQAQDLRRGLTAATALLGGLGPCGDTTALATSSAGRTAAEPFATRSPNNGHGMDGMDQRG